MKNYFLTTLIFFNFFSFLSFINAQQPNNSLYTNNRIQLIWDQTKIRIDYNEYYFEKENRTSHILSYNKDKKLVQRISELQWNFQTGKKTFVYDPNGKLILYTITKGTLQEKQHYQAFYGDTLNQVYLPENKTHVLERDDLFYLFDADYQFIKLLPYDEVFYETENLRRVRIGNYPSEQFGFIDQYGNEVIPLIYNKASTFEDGFATVVKGEKKFRIDKTGKKVKQQKPETKAGYFNSDDRLVSRTIPKNISFHNYVKLRSQQKELGVITPELDKYVPQKYQRAWLLSPSLIKVQKGNRLGVIDTNGIEIVPVRYKTIERLSNNLTRTPLLNDLFKVSHQKEHHENIKWKLIYSSGEVFSNQLFEEAYSFTPELIYVNRKGKYGLLDMNGHYVIPPKYDQLKKFSVKTLLVKKDNFFYLTDFNGELVSSHRFRYIDYIINHLGIARAQIEGKWGWFNSTGDIVIAPVYDELLYFKDGICSAKKNGRWGAIDMHGNTIVPFQYNYVNPVNKGFIFVRNRGKHGVLNTQGEVIIPLEYDEVTSFTYGVARIKKNNKFGWINNKGRIIVPAVYDYIYSFNSKIKGTIIALVRKDKKFGVIDTSGAEVVPLQYDQLTSLHYDSTRLWASKNGKFGLIRFPDSIVLPFVYDERRHVKQINGKWYSEMTQIGKDSILHHLIDYDGNCSKRWKTKNINLGCKRISYLQKGLHEKNRKYGWINWNGDTICPPQYRRVDNFNGIWSKVWNKRKQGIIDTSGKVIIPPGYDHIELMDHHLFKVFEHRLIGLIDANGKVLCSPRYHRLNSFESGKSLVMIRTDKGEKFGLIDTLGKEVIPAAYDHVQSYNSDYYFVMKGKKMGLFNSTGKLVLPFGNYTSSSHAYTTFMQNRTN